MLIKCFPAKIRNKERMSALKAVFQHHNEGSSKHNKTRGGKKTSRLERKKYNDYLQTA